MRERGEIKIDRDLKFSFKSHVKQVRSVSRAMRRSTGVEADRLALQIDALLCAAAGQYRAARRAAYNRGAHEHIIQCLTCGKILTAKSAKRRYCPGQRCRDTHLKRLRRHAAMVRRIKADLERVERARARRIARAITLQLATLRDPQTAWKLDGATLWDKENRRRELIAAREKSELTADEFFQENLSPTEIHRIEAR